MTRYCLLEGRESGRHAEGRRHRVKQRPQQRCRKRGQCRARRLVGGCRSCVRAEMDDASTSRQLGSRTKGASFRFGRSSIWRHQAAALSPVRRCPSANTVLHDGSAASWGMRGQQTGAVRCVGAGAADVRLDQGWRAPTWVGAAAWQLLSSRQAASGRHNKACWPWTCGWAKRKDDGERVMCMLGRATVIVMA